MRPVLTVEEVGGGKALARMVELPHALSGDDPRVAPLVLAWERYRLDPNRNPVFDRGDGRYFLARRGGRPVGRITAHVVEPGGEGLFGFWWCDDDLTAGEALVEAARTWLDEQGCRTMTGPLSFTAAEETGVLVEGFDVPGLTGRAWHPPHLARLLTDLGFAEHERRSTWRLRAVDLGVELPLSDDRPGQAGGYIDPRLVLAGVAAVPDVSDVLRQPRLRGALAAARRAKAGDWSVATVVRCDVDPAVGVPAIQTAAARAGYESVVAPWTPDPHAAPETTHATFRLTW